MSQLEPPDQTNLPCFVYGLFKPGELAFRRISQFLEADPVPAVVVGTLWIRDGLPLLDAESGGRTCGRLLRFHEARAQDAYKVISAFEPKHHYSWQTVELIEPDESANLLTGRGLPNGAVPSECDVWNSSDDPVFSWGIKEVPVHR